MKKNMIAAAVALTFAGCLTLAHNIVLGAPDFTCSQGMRVYLQGYRVDQQSTCDAVGRAWAACDATCPIATKNLTDYPIKWMSDPFPCGPRMVHGCDYNSDIYVANQRVIVDEIGHICLGNCGIVSEIELPDAGAVYTTDMLKYLQVAQ